MAHGGYFENKDLEDILLFSVSNLSRAQVKRLVAKVNSEKDKVGHHNFFISFKVETDTDIFDLLTRYRTKLGWFFWF